MNCASTLAAPALPSDEVDTGGSDRGLAPNLAARRRSRLAALLMVIQAAAGAAPAVAQGQPTDPMAMTAMALAAYERSKDTCFYEPVVGNNLRQMADQFARNSPYRWRSLQNEAQASPDMMQNFATILGGGRGGAGPNACDVHANTIGLTLGFALVYVSPSPELMAAMRRLSKGGRSISQRDSKDEDIDRPRTPIRHPVLNFETLSPLVGAYEACWADNQSKRQKSSCLDLVRPKLQEANGRRKLDAKTALYAELYIENLMLRRWYDLASSQGQWDQSFPDFENIGNSCAEHQYAFDAIDCTSKAGRRYLVPVWNHMQRKIRSGQLVASNDSHNDDRDRATIVSYHFKTITSCIFSRPDQDMAASHRRCVKQSATEVGELTPAIEIDTMAAIYERAHDWLKSIGSGVGFVDVSHEKAACLKAEAKAECMTGRAVRIMTVARERAQATGQLDSFKAAF